jgi:hypothetical protein
MKRKSSINVTKLDAAEAKAVSERFQLTRELDRTQMQIEIAQPKHIKTAHAASMPSYFTTVCGDGKDFWLIAVRKSLRGKNVDTVYQVQRPKRISDAEMQQALFSIQEQLTGLPKGVKIRDADLFEF